MNTYLEATFGSVENIPEVKVAVIDSGVDYTHPFFSGRIDTEDGYDYVNNDNDPMDDHSHGTHVSGIICDNTLSNVKIIPYKTLNKNGSGSLSNMLYAMKEADRCGANVINLSLASPTSKMTITASTKSLFKRIIDTDNIVVVAVTGNISASFPQGQSFPACIDGVLGVGSCDSNGVISSTSNYYDDMVDLVAPGVKIYSTVTNGEYAYKSGTSMACPFVSSAAAILKSCDEDYTPAQIEQMLEATAIDRGTVGYDSLYGNGIVNLRLLYSKYYSPLEYTDPLEDINYYNNRISYKYMYSGLSATVIIAGYSNGQLKKSVIDRLNKQANVSVDFNMDNYDTVKIMVWSDLNALRPFTQAYKLK